MVIICTTCFNVQTLCILPTQCIYMFRMILAVNCHYFPKQHQPLVLCNGDAVFSLWFTIWFFISYLNQSQSSTDRALAQAVSRRSAPRRSDSIPGQSVCRLKCTKWHCAQFRQRSLLLSWPEEPSITDSSEQLTETYLRRMDLTGLIGLPCAVLRVVIIQFCTAGWRGSRFPSWVLILPAMPLPHTL